MNLPETLVLDDKALVSWYMLPASAQSEIVATLAGLAGRPPEAWTRTDVEPWIPHDGLYALHVMVGPDELLVFFRPEKGRIRIEGMLLKETIDRFARRA